MIRGKDDQDDEVERRLEARYKHRDGENEAAIPKETEEIVSPSDEKLSANGTQAVQTLFKRRLEDDTEENEVKKQRAEPPRNDDSKDDNDGADTSGTNVDDNAGDHACVPPGEEGVAFYNDN